MKLKRLEDLGACQEALAWLATQRTAREAWANCARSDWMLWLIAHSKKPLTRREAVSLACDFAERVLRFIPAEENRPAKAIAIARLWLEGKATRDECYATAAAYHAAAAAYRAAAHAHAAADAAAHAHAAAADAAAAYHAAAAAANAAAAAAADADAECKAQADIIRRMFPTSPKF